MMKETAPSEMALSERDRRAQRRQSFALQSETSDENQDREIEARADAAADDDDSSSSDDEKQRQQPRHVVRSSNRRTTQPPAAAAAAASSSRQSQQQRGPEKRESSTTATSAWGTHHHDRQSVKKQKTTSVTVTTTAKSADGDGSSSTTIKRTYNLRATTARKQAHQMTQERQVATVTPAAAASAAAAVRQINFFDNSPIHNSDANDLNKNNRKCQAVVVLPPGVVNIFDERQPLLKQPACHCPFDRNIQLDTALIFAHIASYGKEHVEALRESEMGHWEQLSEHFTPEALQEALASPCSSSVAPSPVSSNGSDVEVGSSPESAVSTRSGTPSPSRSGALKRIRVIRSPSSSFQSDRHAVSGDMPLPRQPLLSPRMRGILVNWLVEVSLEYKMSTRALHLAVSILDYLLWLGPTTEELGYYDPEEDDENDPEFFFVPRSDFQAVGCACIWVASKFEDKSPPSIDDLIYIADHSFCVKKLRSLETRICRELNFSFGIVTPIHYVNIFLRASHACPCRSCQYDHPVLRELVLYLIELSRLSYDLTLRCPSLLAAAAVYLGRATLGMRETNPTHALHPEGYWTKTLQYYTKYSIEDLRDAVLDIYRYQLTAEQSEHFQGVYQKYRAADRHYVSSKPALRIEDLGLVRGIKHDQLDINRMVQETQQSSFVPA